MADGPASQCGSARPLGVEGPGADGTSDGIFLNRSWSIAGVRISNRVVLGPMAGVTNSAFRTLCRRYGAGLVVSEMVSAYGLRYRNRRTRDYLRFREEERPIAVQLFGDEPRVLAEGAAVVLENEPRPDLLDLNLGCPVRKVVRSGAGCALAERPELAAACLEALVSVAGPRGVPVTAKIRSGPRPGEVTAIELAQRLEAAGAAAVAVHPRAASQMYRCRADHAVTAAVGEAITVPVIASGDVDSVAAGRAVISRTGAAAIMVARGVLGNPKLIAGLLSGEEPERPSVAEAVDALLELADLAEEDMGSERAGRWLRKHVGWFLSRAGVEGRIRDALQREPDLEPLRCELRSLAEGRFGSSEPPAV
ncbi:MAG: tRNA dihydrouridine synthase DusB [Thermoleophilia bacterium]